MTTLTDPVESPTPSTVTADTSLFNNPERLRERASALEAAKHGEPVDKECDGCWIELEAVSSFFFDRRYRARPSKLPPHQQRVIDEKRELDERLAKLRTFLQGTIFMMLDDGEKDCLVCQESTMEMYSDLLGERLALWGIS